MGWSLTKMHCARAEAFTAASLPELERLSFAVMAGRRTAPHESAPSLLNFLYQLMVGAPRLEIRVRSPMKGGRGVILSEVSLSSQ